MDIKSLRNLVTFMLIIIYCCSPVSAQSDDLYDIVLKGGRVIDPETKLDAIRNVGIQDNRIALISHEDLNGKEIINVSGLIVAPGFIDLHVHGRSNREQEFQLHDGVTTALELEWGIGYPDNWYASRKGKALINYGASVSWPFERFIAMDKYKDRVNDLRKRMLNDDLNFETLFNELAPSYTDNLNPGETDKMLANIKTSLEQGCIGIGVPIGYLPKTLPGEMFRVYRLAGELNVLVFSHVREPGILYIQEAIADAVLTGAPLHLVHINSMALGQIELALDMIMEAQKKVLILQQSYIPTQLLQHYCRV